MRASALQCAILVVITGTATNVFAGDPASCTTIVDDRARLACYDAALLALARKQDVGPMPVSTGGPDAPIPRDRRQEVAETPASTRGHTQCPDSPARQTSLIGNRWARYQSANTDSFLVRLHNPNYLIFRHSDRVDTAPTSPGQNEPDREPGIQHNELKFQVSFKARLWAKYRADCDDGDNVYSVWLGYTQQSNWQALNAPQSRPFRESNYEPELMFVVQPDRPLGGGFRWQLLNLGFVHQSNGRSDPASRSWNRLYAQFGIERDGFGDGTLAILARPWLRLHESKDDNPNILDYLGYGDVVVLWKHGEQTLTFTGRLNPRTRKGAAQIEWSTPLPGLESFRFYVQAFTGYGESLIDYNFRQTVVGAGVSLNDLY